ncbi:class I SAM-dependent methyltransferase [Paenibacillus alvei]|uniref:SAM-dependent methyltransferase n=1 Tax=Paenibacillus alvei TaxID=44250 RepID=A0A383RA04_PAEAL|nr:class I SAM-dependent methyltransferase [Paenibacillus alvei]SYX83788.1 SAM-dependent methyltransferase [Paenibacillus alvei]
MKNRLRSIYELLSIVDGIEGWLSNYEQFALLQLPTMVDHVHGGIVEIGSFKGKSAIALALGSLILSHQKRPIYAIDPFVVPPFHFFWDNVLNQGLESFIVPIQKHSVDALQDCPDEIAAIFIDGDHEYAGVKSDILQYAPKVAAGGLLVFHDYSDYWPGVRKAVDECCSPSEYEYITIYDSMLFIRKK